MNDAVIADQQLDAIRCTWRAVDGLEMPFRYCGPSAPRAVAVAVPGICGASDDFEPLLEPMQQIGVGVYTMNLRGQGCDAVVTRRGDLENPAEMIDDVLTFLDLVATEHPGLPLILMGESMGALVSVYAAARRPARAKIDALVLFSPVVMMGDKLRSWQRVAIEIAVRMIPRFRLRPHWFQRKGRGLVTSDPVRQKFLRSRPENVPGFTVRFLLGLGRLIERAVEQAASLHLPVLVLGAGQDVFIAPKFVAEFHDRIGSSEKRLLLYPESYHLLLWDTHAANTIRDVTAWVDENVARFARQRA
jgi:acylglycerol lipase